MSALTEKRRLLENAGFVYNFDRELYYNRNVRKAFSVEFIEDHNNIDLEQFIKENSDARSWRFYFNSPLSNAVRRELISVLE